MVGYSDWSSGDWKLAIPIAALAGVTAFFAARQYYCGAGLVNLSVRKNESKVADSCSTGDIEDKKVFCRCWRSKQFPYCDGSHNKHNEVTGDNVGPVIVKKST